MDDKEILENGYHEYEPTCFHSDGITKCFQKRFDDDIGKKYFIDIHKWDYDHGDYHHLSYEFSVQLHYNDKPIDLTLFNNWEIKDVEEWIEEVWKDMGCDYYERWDY